MFPVSVDYMTAIRAPAVRTKLSGSVGSTQFNEYNVVRDSFSITNQCSGSDQVQIGQVYIGELEITLTGLTFDRYSLHGERIVPYFGLNTIGATYEKVPLGTFFVGEAEYVQSGIHVKAYDAMSLLDKPCRLTSAVGRPYSLAKKAAKACDVVLANTAAEFRAFANGDTTLQLYQDGTDIETWRDFVSWIAQACGCFVTATRGGGIQFRAYGQTVVDTIRPKARFYDVKFSDFETRYTGLSVVNIKDNTTSYYHEDPDDGLTYNLGSNPFLQYGTAAGRAQMRGAVLTALQSVQYVPFSAATVANPAFDLGDVLSFPGGLGDASKLFCVTKYTWKYGDSMQLEGVGSDPALASAQSKSDKNLAGIASRAAADVLGFYTYENPEPLAIGNGQTVDLFSFDYATSVGAQLLFNGEIDILTDAGGGEGNVKITYYLDEVEQEYHPAFRVTDGLQLEHLLYTWRSPENLAGNFRATLTALDASLSISAGNLRAVLFGQGLTGEGGDKDIVIDESVPGLEFDIIGDFTDAVTT